MTIDGSQFGAMQPLSAQKAQAALNARLTARKLAKADQQIPVSFQQSIDSAVQAQAQIQGQNQDAVKVTLSSKPDAVQSLSQPQPADQAVSSLGSETKTVSTMSPAVLSAVTQPGNALPEQTGLPVDIQDVLSIAGQSGFVGVTAQDIQRAYTFGESLLSDYRI
ncbi:MAG: hypothetical protein AAGI66_05450 [Cyanobacteria bacterium P01_H01_bin.74]